MSIQQATISSTLAGQTNPLFTPFGTLKNEIFPQVISRTNQKEFRVWVTGAVSGDNSYTVAIQWFDFLQGENNYLPLRLFCSDLSVLQIAEARRGKYSESQLTVFPPEMVNRFFTREAGLFYIKKHIRDSCLFTDHRFLEQPPYSNIDLLICETILADLLYDERHAAFNKLHYAIRNDSCIIFTRTPADLIPEELFTRLDGMENVYQRKAVFRKKSYTKRASQIPDLIPKFTYTSAQELDRAFQNEILKYTPPCFVLDNELEIIQFYGNTAPFIRPLEGKATLNLLKLVREEFAVAISTLVERTKKDPSMCEEAVTMDSSNYIIHVTPISIRENQYYLARIEKISQNLFPGKTDASNKVKTLNAELIRSREDLLSTREEYEASVQELQATYEEILTANEELEISKTSLEESNQQLDVTLQFLEETKSHLELALQAGSAGTWWWHLATGKHSFSKEMKSLFGLKEGSFNDTMEDWLKIIHAEDKEKFNSAINESARTGHPLEIQFRTILPNQSTKWILCKAKCSTINGHKQMNGVCIDITEQRNAYEKLKESESRFHLVSDQAPVMIWMTDRTTEITFTNKTWLSYTGKTRISGWKEWLSLIHPEDLEKTVNEINHSLTERNEFRLEYRIQKYDNQYRWILHHGVPRFESGNSFIGFIGTCLDIHEQMELRQQKDEFISIASHELKTPVTSIKSYGEILHMKLLSAGDESLRTMFRRMNLQIDKLSGLIDKLLDITKIETGHFEFFSEEFDLNRFVTDVADEMKITTENHTIITEHGKAGVVFGDRDRIGQVLSNLVSNAIKYSPEHTDIVISTDEFEKEFVVRVKDAGSGILEHEKISIFKRFFRSSEPQKKRVAGIGLGLFISAEIIKKHGGRIWVESNGLNGSVFSFTLPKAK